MSTHPMFLELTSDDPMVRAIAHRVQQWLGNGQLTMEERRRLVRQAQRQLREHQARQRRGEALQEQLAQVRLPTGFQARQVLVTGQAVSVGLRSRNAFVWLDAGQLEGAAPAANVQRFDWPKRTRLARNTDKRRSAIDERRRAALEGKR